MENEIIRFTTRITVPVDLESHFWQHSNKLHRRIYLMWTACVVLLFSVNLVAGCVNLIWESNEVTTYLTNTEYYE